MANKYQIHKGDKGIVFIRADTGRVSRVSVKMETARRAIRSYTFRNIPAGTFQSPYISWANLNCCGGWAYDESYLLTAVQEGKKLCAGIVMNDENKYRAFLDNLGGEYPCFCPPVRHNGPYTFYHVDVTRQGRITDYIDMKAARETYSALRIDFLNFDIITEYAEKQMIHLLDGTAAFDYANPANNEQLAVTGLLLGYPLESTAALLLEQTCTKAGEV